MSDTVTSVEQHGTEALTVEAIWATILSAALVTWLKGKVLRPVTYGDQVLLQLPA